MEQYQIPHENEMGEIQVYHVINIQEYSSNGDNSLLQSLQVQSGSDE